MFVRGFGAMVVVVAGLAAVVPASASELPQDPRGLEFREFEFGSTEIRGEFDNCVVSVSPGGDGRLVPGTEICYRTYAGVKQAIAAHQFSPRTTTARSGFVIGEHFDGADLTGASLTLMGGDCSGGGLSLTGFWDNRISSTRHGCPFIEHFDIGDPFPYGGDVEITADIGPGALTILDNRASALLYRGDPNLIEVVTPSFAPNGEQSQRGSGRIIDTPLITGPPPYAGTAPVRAQVVSGPNSGATVSCVQLDFRGFRYTLQFKCDGPSFFGYSAAQGPGVDVVRVWVDNNRDFDFDLGSELQQALVAVVVRRPTTYVALGDSFSSGEGVGTDFGSSDLERCNRSMFAYSQLLKLPGAGQPLASAAAPAEHDAGSVRFYACTSARTYNVVGPGPLAGLLSPDEIEDADRASPVAVAEVDPLQLIELSNDANDLQALGKKVDLVTISIGGNDAGFSDILKECFYNSDCTDPGASLPGEDDPLPVWIPARLDLVEQRVRATMQEVRALVPDASIFLVGYPRLFPDTEPEQTCAALDPPFAGDNLWRPEEQDFINLATDALDARLQAVAIETGVHYVSVAAAFDGHEVCGDAESYIAGPSIGTRFSFDPTKAVFLKGKSFHPNAAGHQAYARAIEDEIDRLIATGVPLNGAGLPRNPDPLQPGSGLVVAGVTGPLVHGVEIEVATAGTDPCDGDRLTYASGEALLVSGAGFATSSIVTVALEGSEVANQPGTSQTVNAAADGSFLATVTLPAVPDDTLFGVLVTGANADGTNIFGRSDVSLLTVEAPPCAVADTDSTDYAVAKQVDVLGNDIEGSVLLDPETVGLTSDPQSGTALANNDGTITYAPDPGFFGDDSFEYLVCDGAGRCSGAPVEIEVVSPCTIEGTDGDDLLEGTPGDDVICGLAGDDTLIGNGGNDVFIGGPGNDVFVNGTGDDEFYGGPGGDVATGGLGADVFVLGGEVGDVTGASAPAGRVQGTITVDRSLVNPAGLRIAWPASCSEGAQDYAIYEGAISAWTSHVALECSDDGADLEAEITPSAGDRYYLVVPRSVGDEGSYGLDSAGVERPAGSSACLATQRLVGCPTCSSIPQAPDIRLDKAGTTGTRLTWQGDLSASLYNVLVSAIPGTPTPSTFVPLGSTPDPFFDAPASGDGLFGTFFLVNSQNICDQQSPNIRPASPTAAQGAIVPRSGSGQSSSIR